MAKTLLPPHGVFAPTGMIYNPHMPPALVLTWIQLRGLAWGSSVTPPFRIQELAALTGRSQSALYQHMSQLRRMSALSWRSTGQGTIIVSFAKDSPARLLNPKIPAAAANPPVPDSENRESPAPASSALQQDDSFSSFKELPEDHQDNDLDKSEEAEGLEEGAKDFQESGNQPRSDAGTYGSAPVVAYRDLIHLTPNSIQRRIVCSKVTNLPLWKETLEHWVGHGWNPRNLTGMLELYERGGAEGCRYCRKKQASTSRERDLSPLELTHAAIDALRREQGLEPLDED